jgi:two-component system response regulator WspF
MRVAIVNDSPLAVEALRRVIARDAAYRIAWVAADGAEAVARCLEDRPDILLMDLSMPVMDGVESTRRIMAEAPCAILVVTATVKGRFTEVYDAMGAGALDAVNTPELKDDDDPSGGAPLLDKLARVARLVVKTDPEGAGEGATGRRAGVAGTAKLPPLVAIGASTGGPQALGELLGHLPASLGAPVVIVQHVDVEFAPGLASWLGERSALPVEVARAGGTLRPGVVLLAATNDHLILTSRQTLDYTPHPRRLVHRPSVDVFFRSLAEHWSRPSVAAVLTGMGKDGAEGLLQLRRAGWFTVAQDRATSVVYGMPRAAADAGAAVRVLPIGQIGPAIAIEVDRRRRSG